MLRELGSGDGARRCCDDVTGRIRHFVLRRVAALGEPGARLLGIAAALDGEFDVALARPRSRTAREQSTAGSRRPGDRRRALARHRRWVRSTSCTTSPAVRSRSRPTADVRAAVHRESRRCSNATERAAARIASQWSRAAGADASAKTHAWAERAGDEALRDLDPHAAAGWFELAADACDDRARAPSPHPFRRCAVPGG